MLRAFLSLCPHKVMAVGSFALGLAAALHGQAGGMEGGEGWGSSECARVQTLLQWGSLEHRHILQWLQLTPEIIWEVGTGSLHDKSWQCYVLAGRSWGDAQSQYFRHLRKGRDVKNSFSRGRRGQNLNLQHSTTPLSACHAKCLVHLLLLYHPSVGSAAPIPPGTAWTHCSLSSGRCCALGQETKGH